MCCRPFFLEEAVHVLHGFCGAALLVLLRVHLEVRAGRQADGLHLTVRIRIRVFIRKLEAL